MVGHGGSSAGSYLADPTSPIPSHCASIVMTGTVRVNYWHNFATFWKLPCCATQRMLAGWCLVAFMRNVGNMHGARRKTNFCSIFWRNIWWCKCQYICPVISKWKLFLPGSSRCASILESTCSANGRRWCLAIAFSVVCIYAFLLLLPPAFMHFFYFF